MHSWRLTVWLSITKSETNKVICFFIKYSVRILMLILPRNQYYVPITEGFKKGYLPGMSWSGRQGLYQSMRLESLRWELLVAKQGSIKLSHSGTTIPRTRCSPSFGIYLGESLHWEQAYTFSSLTPCQQNKLVSLASSRVLREPPLALLSLACKSEVKFPWHVFKRPPLKMGLRTGCTIDEARVSKGVQTSLQGCVMRSRLAASQYLDKWGWSALAEWRITFLEIEEQAVLRVERGGDGDGMTAERVVCPQAPEQAVF